MTTLLDAARQALVALECMYHTADPGPARDVSIVAFDALRTAIAEAEKAEPVAWRYRPDASWPWALTDYGYLVSCKRPSYQVEALFTHPPQREPLTFAQGQELLAITITHPTIYEEAAFRKGVRAAERAHGIGDRDE